MALLTLEGRAERFKYLGLGEYNTENIKKFQRKAFPKQSGQWDGKWGTNSDNALRTFYNVKKITKNFEPEEFRCTCGRCSGYPSYMKQNELKNLQAIRDHYGRPMIVTSGLRCKASNSASTGSIPNSGHLYGRACDFYMKGVTDTLTNRKRSIEWMKKLDNTKYIYGNGINSYGVRISAPYMGNAMHYEVKATTVSQKKTKAEKIVEWAKKIANDDSFIYVHYDSKDPKTRKCPICHNYPKGKYHGFYCTRWNISAWHHGGGIPVKCDNAPNNGQIEKIYNAKTNAEALKLARKYFGVHDIQVIRSKGGIPQKALKAGDSCYYFRGSTCQHAFLYIGNGKMIDANSYKDKSKQIAVRKAMSCKVAVRYVGK